jgi:hypothetical protein
MVTDVASQEPDNLVTLIANDVATRSGTKERKRATSVLRARLQMADRGISSPATWIVLEDIPIHHALRTLRVEAGFALGTRTDAAWVA